MTSLRSRVTLLRRPARARFQEQFYNVFPILLLCLSAPTPGTVPNSCAPHLRILTLTIRVIIVILHTHSQLIQHLLLTWALPNEDI
jgi:hypothetical protein